MLETIDSKYQGKTKGIFLPNDTFANIMLNHLIQKYGQLPDDYKIIGFDDSPVSREAIVPISTVGQQIDKIAALDRFHNAARLVYLAAALVAETA